MTFTAPQVWHAGTDVIGGRPVKRYHISRDGAPIDSAIEQAALALIPGFLGPEDDTTPPAAFTVLFRSSAGAHLNVYSWYWDNVIHARFAGGGVLFLGCPDEDPAHLVPMDGPVTGHLIGCTFELGVVVHERAAWIRHVFAPEQPDLDAYVADVLADGPIGLT
ncbi:hypothetical protein [Streptacidiphilus sp. PAMC 29251]